MIFFGVCTFIIMPVPVNSLPDCKTRTYEKKPSWEETAIERVTSKISCTVYNKLRETTISVIKSMGFLSDEPDPVVKRSGDAARAAAEAEAALQEAAAKAAESMNEARFMMQSDDGNRLIKDAAMKDNKTKVTGRSIDDKDSRSFSDDDDRIIFPTDDGITKTYPDLPSSIHKHTTPEQTLESTSEQTPESTPTINGSLDDRAAINSPITCEEPGQIRDKDGICRIPTKLQIMN